ncbi:MAG: transcriptional regulator [Myxococcales bacterium]|nr:transcriptional regulator [Myxococcales bacterium]
MTRVPLLDLTRFSDDEELEYIEKFRSFIRSGQYIMGPEVEKLEEECATYCETKYSLGVSSGTDALLLALMALGVGDGDEVICPSYTFFATAGCIWRSGAKPVFVDSCLSDYNIDCNKLEDAITERTKAIIPVHLFGQCADMDRLMPIAEKHNLYVIEDAAQAIGAEMHYQGKIRKAGSVGHFGCFSFFPTKNLGGFGDGGLISTNDLELYNRAKIMRVHGGEPKYYHQVVGGNFRLDPLQATLLRPRLKKLDTWTKARQENASLYKTLLLKTGIAEILEPNTTLEEIQKSQSIFLPVETQPRHIYNQFTLLLPNKAWRDALRQKLAEAQIGCEIYYPVPLHKQECFASLASSSTSLPMAEFAADRSCAIPIFPDLREEEILYVVENIKNAFLGIKSRGQ